MRLFLDTEFTGLGQRRPRLISIGLVAEDGSQFYAELPPSSYQDKITPWVRENVLPLLQGGSYVLEPDDLRRRMSEWIAAHGPAVIACDSLDYDFKFMFAILHGSWPSNLACHPLLLTMNYLNDYDAFATAIEAGFASGLRRHHALDDAKANLLAWRASGGDIGVTSASTDMK